MTLLSNHSRQRIRLDWSKISSRINGIFTTILIHLSLVRSVKFGIKTDKVIPGINWKVLDNSGNQIDTGLVIPGEIPNSLQDLQSTDNKNSEDLDMSMTEKSSFRIVPERPNIGSSIRVTGDNFGSSQEFDFTLIQKKLVLLKQTKTAIS